MLRQYQITQLIIEKYSNEKHFFKFSYCVLHLFDFSTFILHVSKDAAEGGENFWHILNTFAEGGGIFYILTLLPPKVAKFLWYHTQYSPPGRNFFEHCEIFWGIMKNFKVLYLYVLYTK